MFADDAAILLELGHEGADLLGSGGEAHVYALDPKRVLRIARAGVDLASAQARAALLAEIAQGATHLPFLTPSVESVGQSRGRVYSFERRLPGQPVSHVMESLAGTDRRSLLDNYLEAASQISSIGLTRELYGPLLGPHSLQTTNWNGFLRARLDHSLAACPADLRPAVARMRHATFDEPVGAALVHMDFFPGNVLAEVSRITAVLDFGPSTIIGDARMEMWSAVAYLDPEISPAATDQDREQALAWLTKRGLITPYSKAKRWLAAYWSFASDDAALMRWCRRVLLAD